MSNTWRAVVILAVFGIGMARLMIAQTPDASAANKITYEDYPPITPRGYVCYRAAKPIVIDGKLDDAGWADAPWSEDFVDIEGDKKPAPPGQRTRVKMLWDEHYLYIGAQLDEKHVWGTLTQHDSVIFKDNDFEVFIDPDGDSHLYAELEINALNTTWDLLLTRPYKNGGLAIDGWEIPGLKTAVHVDGTLNDPRDIDRGWSVEIAWPWKSLREIRYLAVPTPGGSIRDRPETPKDGEQWRINFSRVEWPHEIVDGKYKVKGKVEDNWVWSPQGAIDMHRPERWGIVQFSTAKPGTAEFRLDSAAEDARYRLHRVLYAQMAYRKARGNWALRLADLRLTGPAFNGVDLQTTRTSFEASTLDSRGRRWHIRADGRIWME